MLTPAPTLKELLSKNLPLHLAIANETKRTPYGQITFNVELINGVAQMKTLNVVKNKRTRYH
jgi:hypothetical protein